MTAAPTHPVDVLLLLVRDGEVLLGLRRGTGYADGQWNLPSGKLEHGENARQGVIRETYEEIGVVLGRDEPRLSCTVHHRSRSDHARIGLAFAVTFDAARHGAPVNAEPHKCARVEWFPLDGLPAETYPYSAACVRGFREGTPFVLSGWS